MHLKSQTFPRLASFNEAIQLTLGRPDNQRPIDDKASNTKMLEQLVEHNTTTESKYGARNNEFYTIKEVYGCIAEALL